MARIKNNDIKYDDLLNLIALEAGYNTTPNAVKRVLNAFNKVMLKELKLNHRFYVKDLGAFTISAVGGKDKLMGDFDNGGTVVRYIRPKLRLGFTPASGMNYAINENDFELREHKNRSKKSPRLKKIEHNMRRRKPKPSMEEVLTDMLNY